MNTLTLFLILGLITYLFFYYLKNKSIRKKATFGLYAVRDDLISLVAEGKISESSRIFQYYYKRVNLLLENAPNVGLDDAMNGFLYLQESKNFEHSLKEAKRRAEEMLSLVANEDSEVSTTISNYYVASRDMILAHSSIARILYIGLLKAPSINLYKKIIPEKIEKIIKTIKFAENEADIFRGHSF